MLLNTDELDKTTTFLKEVGEAIEIQQTVLNDLRDILIAYCDVLREGIKELEQISEGDTYGN